MDQQQADSHIAILKEQGLSHEQAVTTVWLAMREERKTGGASVQDEY